MGGGHAPLPSELWTSQYGGALENASSETDIRFMIPQRPQTLTETEPDTESLGWDREEGVRIHRGEGHGAISGLCCARRLPEMTTADGINIKAFGQASRVGGSAGAPGL